MTSIGGDTEARLAMNNSILSPVPITLTRYASVWILDDIPRPAYTDLIYRGIDNCIELGVIGAQSIDLSFVGGGNAFKIAPAGTVTLSLANVVVGVNQYLTFNLIVIMGATVHTVNWFSDLTWEDGNVPVLEANKIHYFAFHVHPLAGLNYKVIGNKAYAF